MTTLSVTHGLSVEPGEVFDASYVQLLPTDRLLESEAHSRAPDDRLGYRAAGHGFVAAAKYAFANHRALSLAPHHLWLMIQQAVADHVSLHAKELRERWVSHEGTRVLKVFRPEAGRLDWVDVIENPRDGFRAQLRANTLPDAFDQLTPAFSTSTPTDQVVGGITVMHTLRHYFEYKVFTLCGIPEVRMEGTLADWQQLVTAANTLVNARCTAAFAGFWLPPLLRLLETLVQQYRAGTEGGVVDSVFWNTICKSGGSHGSGATTWLDGWFNVLLPYAGTRYNEYCRFPLHMHPSRSIWIREPLSRKTPGGGLEEQCIPSGVRSVPFTLDCTKAKMHGGFLGIREEEGFVAPVVGWYITA